MSTCERQSAGPAPTVHDCPFDTILARTPYFVLPKLAIQAMPIEWRRRFADLLDEAEAAGLKTPSYLVLRDGPEYSRSVPEDEDDSHGPLDSLDVVRPDPWADYRRGNVRELCPTLDLGRPRHADAPERNCLCQRSFTSCHRPNCPRGLTR